MAPNHTAVRLTPIAALLDASLRRTNDRGLATTLAILRMPSRTWMTYEAIAALLEPHAHGRVLNRVSIKTYAETLFDIPNTRYVTLADGKVVGMPKAVDETTVERYLTTLDARSIDIDAVRAAAVAELRRAADEAAQIDTARAAAMAEPGEAPAEADAQHADD